MIFSVVQALLLLTLPRKAAAFARSRHYLYVSPIAVSRLASDAYCRGAEIWPPGSEELIRLEDSFPGGIIPIEAAKVLNQMGSMPPAVKRAPIRWRRVVSDQVDNILRRAAGIQEAEKEESGVIRTAIPWIIAVAIAATGCLRPLDLLLVSFVTGYICLLQTLAASVRSSDGVTPVLPALPPQGHVPWHVAHPLGYELYHSRAYERWLQLGVATGLQGPLVFLLMQLLLFTQNGIGGIVTAAAAFSLAARPLFLLSCQIITENLVSRRVTTPLPIRILVPVVYNTIRLGYLWQWTLTPTTTISIRNAAKIMPSLGALTVAGRCLAVANLVYWASNLFGFLLPTAVVKYFRVHVMTVEAAQVVTRSGMTGDIV